MQIYLCQTLIFVPLHAAIEISIRAQLETLCGCADLVNIFDTRYFCTRVTLYWESTYYHYHWIYQWLLRCVFIWLPLR